MKQFILAIIALTLTACSIEGMTEKMVPEDVRADHAAHIDRLLEGDTSRMIAAFSLDPSDEDVAAQIKGVTDEVPTGAEIRRDYVGVNSSAKVSVGEGKSRNIDLISEVQTEGGFMLVTTQYALDQAGNCCALTNLNVQKSDTSPIREGLEAAAKVGKIVGIIFLLSVLALVLFLVRRSRKKRKLLQG